VKLTISGNYIHAIAMSATAGLCPLGLGFTWVTVDMPR